MAIDLAIEKLGQLIPLSPHVRVGQIDILMDTKNAPFVDDQAFLSRHSASLLTRDSLGQSQGGKDNDQQNSQGSPAHWKLMSLENGISTLYRRCS
ncbi:MAG TPA: hypothetical protein VGZ25_14275 [Gemmataceae bacterium]|nr:hypothetical protein [Gemmataceae bacterium]